MKRKTLKSQVACYLSLNIISVSDRGPRQASVPLITLDNFLMAIKLYVLAMLHPTIRGRAWVRLTVAEIVLNALLEITTDVAFYLCSKRVFETPNVRF